MARKRTERQPLEWAARIFELRKRLNASQSDLARMINCSAMTVSRWENGLLPPTGHYYIELGKLAGKSDCWFFWELAGLQSSDVIRLLPERDRKQLFTPDDLSVAPVSAGSGSKELASPVPKTVPIPVLDATAGTHGERGDRRGNLRQISFREIMSAPADWCPNPSYTSMLRVRGRSMEPLIRDGDITAVDSSQTDRTQLSGKVVIVASDERGLCVSRLRSYEKLDILESENREYQPVVLDKKSGWRIVGRVLWWISAAP
jgi:phage repressor protein C with HTH and peptisase S24 domain